MAASRQLRVRKRPGGNARIVRYMVFLAFLCVLAPLGTNHRLRGSEVPPELSEPWPTNVEIDEAESSLTPQIPSKWLKKGEELFILESANDAEVNMVRTASRRLTQNQQSARVACHWVDELKAAKDDSATWQFPPRESDEHLFKECMELLEESQTDFRISFPDFDSRQCTESEQELIHTVWDVKGSDKKLPKTALLGVLSMVLSYPHGCVKLKIWVVNPRTTDIVQSELQKYLKHDAYVIQILDFGRLCDRISLVHPSIAARIADARPKLSLLNGGPSQSTNFAAYSDIIRVFVLAAYGGVYLDCDMVLLRPLTPLLSHDFYYRWSYHRYANTAAMHMQLGSVNARELIEKVLDLLSWYPSQFLSKEGSISLYSRFESEVGWALHPQYLYYELARRNATVQLLPSSYFDPLWLIDEGFCDCEDAANELFGLSTFQEEFFGKVNKNKAVIDDVRGKFFPGAFAFHFHNQWNAEFVPGSSADLLLKEFLSLAEQQA